MASQALFHRRLCCFAAVFVSSFAAAGCSAASGEPAANSQQADTTGTKPICTCDRSNPSQDCDGPDGDGDGDDDCTPCVEGAACAAQNPCVAGALTCAGGPRCQDTGRPLPDGTSCGAGRACNAGTCTAVDLRPGCTREPDFRTTHATSSNPGGYQPFVGEDCTAFGHPPVAYTCNFFYSSNRSVTDCTCGITGDGSDPIGLCCCPY